MEVGKGEVRERFNGEKIATPPTVVYEVEKTDGTRVTIQNPSELPPTQNIAKIFEPYVKATILTPNEYLGNLLPAS